MMRNMELALAVCGPNPSRRELAEIADMYGVTFPELYRAREKFGIPSGEPGCEIPQPAKLKKNKENEVKKMGKSSLTTSEVRKIDEWRSEGIGWIEIAERLGRKNPKSLNACYVYAKQKLGEEPIKVKAKSRENSEFGIRNSELPSSVAADAATPSPEGEADIREVGAPEKVIIDYDDDGRLVREEIRRGKPVEEYEMKKDALLEEAEKIRRFHIENTPERQIGYGREERKHEMEEYSEAEPVTDATDSPDADADVEFRKLEQAEQERTARMAARTPTLLDLLTDYGYYVDSKVIRMSANYQTAGLYLVCENPEDSRHFTVCVSCFPDECGAERESDDDR